MLASFALVTGAAFLTVIWDQGLCGDDGAADNGSVSATSYCSHWDTYDVRYPPWTWLLPMAFVLVGGLALIIARRPRLATAVGGTALLVQAALLLRSMNVI
jgi:hypothetical protein